MINIFTRNGRCRLRIRLLEMAAARGFSLAERMLRVIRETGAELPSHLAWKALRRLQERRYFALCEKLDAERAGSPSRKSP